MKRNIAGLITLLAAICAGCGAQGPWSPKNAWENYPPKVRSVGWVVPASVVVVSYQPYDATRVDVDGWAIYSNQNINSDGPRVHLAYNLREALDTTKGRGFFLLVQSDWSGWNADRPLLASLDHYLLISIHDPDGVRVGVELWKLSGGTAENLQRTATNLPTLVGNTILSVADWKSADRAELAKQIAKTTP